MYNLSDNILGKAAFLVILFLLAEFGQLRAQSTVSGMSPLDVAKLKSVHEIAIAPSGKEAIYTLSVPADPTKKNERPSYQLYMVNLNTGRSIPFVTSMNVLNIAFRPHHNAITFLARRSAKEKKLLYQISLSGGEPRLLFKFPRSLQGYSWASDGNQLAFMAPDTTLHQGSPLPYQPEIYEENLAQRRGFVTDLSKGYPSINRVKVKGSIYQMRWSPSGDKLALSVAPTPLTDDYFIHQQVMIVDGKGQKVLKKISHRGKQGAVKWSPGGHKLAMLAGGDPHDPVAGRLFVFPADSGASNQLRPDFKGDFEAFSWVNDSTLHYLSSQGLWTTYGSIRSDGIGMMPIIKKGEAHITNFDRLPDGHTIFMANTSTNPSELYQLNPISETLSRITFSNPWLKNKALGKQKVVSWQAKNGKELEGLLIYPINYNKNKIYPLITAVHGGPAEHYSNGWVTDYATPGQVAAGQGYFVFYPNYRGSSGRGEQFAKSSQGDLAGADFKDIVDGINKLIKTNIIDSSKVGVTGGSYGGFATAWLSTRYTQKFAAGVMLAGISDNISKWATSDIPQELYQTHSRKHVWEDYKYFLEHSPIYYASGAQTPLLIAAGKQDKRVNPGQSYELYRHIKARTSTPVRLVLYPGEGHGNTHATARYDYNLRMMRWFDTFLKNKNKKQLDRAIDLKKVPYKSNITHL